MFRINRPKLHHMTLAVLLTIRMSPFPMPENRPKLVTSPWYMGASIFAQIWKNSGQPANRKFPLSTVLFVSSEQQPV